MCQTESAAEEAARETVETVRALAAAVEEMQRTVVQFGRRLAALEVKS